MKRPLVPFSKLFLIGALAVSPLLGTDRFVSPSGNDSASGEAPSAAWRTIQKALDASGPGDEVILGPGVYFQFPVVKQGGERGKPLILRADRIAKGRVILSGAKKEWRATGTSWKAEESASGLFSIPFEYKPSRVLYGDTDLLPYPDLKSLSDFSLCQGQVPGPRQGFAFDPDSKRLFVRLHASGRFGPPDPAKHLMKISPPNGSGAAGRHIGKVGDANLQILMTGEAHVVIQGITFETPGVAGVFTKASDVTVRDSWFVGCRTGVSGTADGKMADEENANRVRVEYCEWHHEPYWADLEECIARFADEPFARTEWWHKLCWWQRKGDQPVAGSIGYENTYETGIVLKAGRDWSVEHCHIHDTHDGISVWASSWSVGLRVSSNRFENLGDNAIELEDHSDRLRFDHNVVIDVFEPLSWQPLGGTPWPGRAMISDNLFEQTARSRDAWKKAGAPGGGGFLKFGAVKKNWETYNLPRMAEVPTDLIAFPDEGIRLERNAVLMAHEVFITYLGSTDRRYDGVRITSNFIAVMKLTNGGNPFPGNGFIFQGNTAGPAAEGQPGPGELLTATGTSFQNAEEAFQKWGLVTRELKKIPVGPRLDPP